MTQKFRRGDIVTVKAVVDTHYDRGEDYPILSGKVSVKVDGQRDTLLLTPEQLTLIVPFFAATDRVRRKEAKHITGEVIATIDGKVWIRFDAGNKMGTLDATEIEIIPAGEEVPAQAAA